MLSEKRERTFSAHKNKLIVFFSGRFVDKGKMLLRLTDAKKIRARHNLGSKMRAAASLLSFLAKVDCFLHTQKKIKSVE